MAYHLNITDTQIVAGLRNFLLNIIGSSTQIINGINNRTPMPVDDFIVINRINKIRLATNEYVYTNTQETITQSTQYCYQIDCYGDNGGEWSNLIQMLFRSDIACSFLSEFNIQPLYTDDPKEIVFINDESQYERRWMIAVYLQVNPSTTFDIVTFATDTVGINLVIADLMKPNDLASFVDSVYIQYALDRFNDRVYININPLGSFLDDVILGNASNDLDRFSDSVLIDLDLMRFNDQYSTFADSGALARFSDKINPLILSNVLDRFSDQPIYLMPNHFNVDGPTDSAFNQQFDQTVNTVIMQINNSGFNQQFDQSMNSMIFQIVDN